MIHPLDYHTQIPARFVVGLPEVCESRRQDLWVVSLLPEETASGKEVLPHFNRHAFFPWSFTRLNHHEPYYWHPWVAPLVVSQKLSSCRRDWLLLAPLGCDESGHSEAKILTHGSSFFWSFLPFLPFLFERVEEKEDMTGLASRASTPLSLSESVFQFRFPPCSRVPLSSEWGHGARLSNLVVFFRQECTSIWPSTC